MIELTRYQETFLNDSVKGDWSIKTDTGLIDVEGSVYIGVEYHKMVCLPVDFGIVTGDFICATMSLITLDGFPIKTGGEVEAYQNPLQRIGWKPEEIGICLCINFIRVSEKYQGKIISEIDELISNGVSLFEPNVFYYPFRGAYYERKMIELL